MSSFLYKDYTATINFSDEDDCFIGHIIGLDDIIGFHGHTATELKSAFHLAVDDYIDTCNAIGKQP